MISMIGTTVPETISLLMNARFTALASTRKRDRSLSSCPKALIMRMVPMASASRSARS
jgi:hypothetical protein